MVKSLYVMSDTHDDLEAVARAVDFARSEGKPGSRIVHVGDLALRPYIKADLDAVVKSKDIQSFVKAIRSRTQQVHDSYYFPLPDRMLSYITFRRNQNYSGHPTTLPLFKCTALMSSHVVCKVVLW